jgi:Fe-S-cluster containining protein
LNESSHPSATVETQLCQACGHCCNGVIFANLALKPGDDAARLRSLGLPVCNSHSALRPPHLAQPCAAFNGCGCRIYLDRPQYCRQFECVLLKSVNAGRTEPAAALRIVRTARERADKVRRLLHALGDTDEQLSLSARFRHAGKRLKERDLDEETADTYSQLTLAVHDLNLLLSDAFYPGNVKRET